MTECAVRSTRKNVARATFCLKQRIYGHFTLNCGTCHIPVTDHPSAGFYHPMVLHWDELFHSENETGGAR